MEQAHPQQGNQVTQNLNQSEKIKEATEKPTTDTTPNTDSNKITGNGSQPIPPKSKSTVQMLRAGKSITHE